jgi:hypothetical protein
MYVGVNYVKSRVTVAFEIFTVVVVKDSVLWDITCSSLRVNRCFRGTYWLAFNGLHGIISQKIEPFKYNNYLKRVT